MPVELLGVPEPEMIVAGDTSVQDPFTTWRTFPLSALDTDGISLIVRLPVPVTAWLLMVLILW